MSNGDSLEDLINQAESELDDPGYSKISKIQKKHRQSFKVPYLSFLPVIILAISYFIYINTHQPLPNAIETQAELIRLLTEARSQVEANSVEGSYPLVLPNAALGAVVNYQLHEKTYSLSAQLNNVLVEMDETGKISIYGVSE